MARAALGRRTYAFLASKPITLLLFCVSLLEAQVQPISQMVHKSWSGRDGAPQGIQAMTQTSDGILWIASLGGLYTFDGITFEKFQGPENAGRFFSQSFHFLLATKTGDLWMFGFHGPPGRLHNGSLEIFDRSQAAPIDVLGLPEEAPDGKIWAVLNERRLVWLTTDGSWRPEPAPGNGSEHITMLYIDSSGTMWLVVDDRLYRRSDPDRAFEPTSIYVYGRNTFEEGFNHDLWISSSGPKTSQRAALHLQHLNRDGQAISSPDIGEGVTDALPAPDGSLWVLTTSNVLAHLTKDGLDTHQFRKISQYADRTQLAVGAEAADIRAFIRGKDGSLWFGGWGGLEQFTTATLVQAMPGASIGDWNACIDPAGALWANDPNGLLYRRDDGSRTHVVAKGIESIFCSAHGSVTLQDQRGLAVLRDGRIDHLPPIPGLRGYLNHYIFTGSMETKDGLILTAVAGGAIGRSLWAYRNGQWERFLPNKAMPEVTAMYGDRDGRVFLGYRGSDEIGVVEGSDLHNVPTGTPGVGRTLGFSETTYGLFAYGANGIAIKEGSRFQMLVFTKPEHATLTTGLTESRDGDVWLNSAAGVVKITSSEVKQAIANPRYRLVSNDIREGDIVGPSFPGFFSSKAQVDLRGRLLFATLNGIVSVDPAAVKPSPPPLLSIRGIRADSHRLSAKSTFPPNLQILAIDYIGVDFKNPRRVSYRYRLDGYDTAWQDAGSRTEAIYTYLKPGTYRFEVMAENAYGVWTEPVISPPFIVLPRFYQRLWFQLFCGFVFAVLTWLIIRARLKFVEAGIRERSEARADERISIARDLHDTLLQGVQGLLLTFHSAAERVPEGHESKVVLEKALATADKIILEGRDRVKGLREQNLTDKELCSALETLGNDLNTSGEIDYSVTCVESHRTLTPHIASEVFLIAREAVINAFRHAHATKISVSVRYGRREFTLECRDDGHGLDLNRPSANSGQRHWGIRGMSERAERLRATFEIRTGSDQGTWIHVGLKAKRAYE